MFWHLDIWISFGIWILKFGFFILLNYLWPDFAVALCYFLADVDIV